MTGENWIETSQLYLDELPIELREHDQACRDLQQHIQEMISKREFNAVKQALQLHYDADATDNYDDDDDDGIDCDENDFDSENENCLEQHHSKNKVFSEDQRETQRQRHHQKNSSCYKCCDAILSSCCFGCALFSGVIAAFLAYYKSLIFAYMDAYTQIISAVVYNYFGVTISSTTLKIVYYTITILLFLFSMIEFGRFLLGFCRAKVIEYRRVDSNGTTSGDIESSSAFTTGISECSMSRSKKSNHFHNDANTPSTIGSTITPDADGCVRRNVSNYAKCLTDTTLRVHDKSIDHNNDERPPLVIETTLPPSEYNQTSRHSRYLHRGKNRAIKRLE